MPIGLTFTSTLGTIQNLVINCKIKALENKLNKYCWSFEYLLEVLDKLHVFTVQFESV